MRQEQGKNHSAGVSCTGHRAAEAPTICGVEDAARSVCLWLKSREGFLASVVDEDTC